jgi:hypothetical protein
MPGSELPEPRPKVELSATGEPTAPDHLGLAVRALLTGVAAGVGAVSAVMWLIRTLQLSGTAPLAPRPSDTVANLVLLGWLGGAVLGAVAAWGMMTPIASDYRRGGLAMVAGFGTLLLAFLTAPVDSLFGRWGLLGLTGLSALLCLLLLRRARRGTT